MDGSLIKEAIWCYQHSREQDYKDNHGNAHRYHICLYELINRMTPEEKQEYEKLIKN